MTVQELLERLEEVEDKSILIYLVPVKTGSAYTLVSVKETKGPYNFLEFVGYYD